MELLNLNILLIGRVAIKITRTFNIDSNYKHLFIIIIDDSLLQIVRLQINVS